MRTIPLWLAIVVGAHLLNALAFLVDKFLLVKAVPKPAVYAFYVGLLGGLAFVLLPFGFALPSDIGQWILDLTAGAMFVLALLCFFSALKRGEASRVVPYVGGTIPIWTLILAYLALGERLTAQQLIAFGVLVLGSALIAREEGTRTTRQKHAYTFASLAAVTFAVSFVLMKAVFNTQAFIPGFVWSRAGALLAALVILLHGPSRRAIATKEKRPHGGLAALFFGGQLAGALGFLALQYAVSLASPTLINAMQGVQYAFLFLLTAVLGRRYAQLRERLSRRIVIQKVVAIIIIGLGLALLGQAA